MAYTDIEFVRDIYWMMIIISLIGFGVGIITLCSLYKKGYNK